MTCLLIPSLLAYLPEVALCHLLLCITHQLLLPRETSHVYHGT
jgi:hypothetical protein